MNAPDRIGPATQILHRVRRIEEVINLSHPSWQQDDVHWWPLYRLELYRLLFRVLASSASSPIPPYRLGPAWRRARTPSSGVVTGALWLVSDGISFSRIGSHEVERFCEPLLRTCASLGLPALAIDRSSERPRDTGTPMRWWAPTTQRAKIAATLAARLRPDPRHVALVQQVNDAAAEADVELPPLDARRFDAMARAVVTLADSLRGAMRRERPRAVFVVSYYDVAGYAYLLAAAREGIDSVDLQHGVAGRYNMAYADWPVREGGWRLLPRWFWTWTEADARVVRGWAGCADTAAHRVVCGGHPFLQAWDDGIFVPEVAMVTALQRLLDSAGTRLRVLVTLQPHLVNPTDLAPLVDVWRRRPDVTWWLRLHPMAPQDRAPLEELLREQGVRHANVDDASALPLPLLLSHAGVHATHSSSTFIEARALGLPTIVWSRYGAELAEDTVAEGSTRVALDGAAFAQALDAVGSAPTARSEPAPSMERALRTILERAQ